MKNVHGRDMRAPIELVRPWIEASWTGTPRDPFPCDVLKSWRKNPSGADPLALIPNVTRVGHGFFSFRFESWDGERWRVRVESKDFQGWHGFDLQTTALGCRVTHTIEVIPSFKPCGHGGISEPNGVPLCWSVTDRGAPLDPAVGCPT